MKKKVYFFFFFLVIALNLYIFAGLKSLKNLDLSYPLFVHSIEVWQFAY